MARNVLPCADDRHLRSSGRRLWPLRAAEPQRAGRWTATRTATCTPDAGLRRGLRHARLTSLYSVDRAEIRAVSKTVVGLTVHRGFESHPLRFLGLIEPNLPYTRAV